MTVAPPAVNTRPASLVLSDVALLDVVASHLALLWSYITVEPASLEPTVSASVVLPNSVAAPARPCVPTVMMLIASPSVTVTLFIVFVLEVVTFDIAIIC